MIYPNLFSLSNSRNPPLPPSEADIPLMVAGYFTDISLGWRGMLYLNLTGRVDQASSCQVIILLIFILRHLWALCFLELLNQTRNKPWWLDFGKLRVNYAQVGNFAPH